VPLKVSRIHIPQRRLTKETMLNTQLVASGERGFKDIYDIKATNDFSRLSKSKISEEDEKFAINCVLCGRKHDVIVRVDYDNNPFVASYKPSTILIRFTYVCPIKSISAIVTLYFTSSESKKFRNARIKRYL
jgi:hypothetical protein